MKKTSIAIIVIAFIAVAFGLLVRLNCSAKAEEVARYNNGICIECGGHLEEMGTTINKADGVEFNRFVCDHCHEVYLFTHIGNKK